MILFTANFHIGFNFFRERVFLKHYFNINDPHLYAIRLIGLFICIILMYIVYFWKKAYFKEKYEQKRKDFYRSSLADLQNNEVEINIEDDQEEVFSRNCKIQRIAFDSLLVLVLIYQVVFVY